ELAEHVRSASASAAVLFFVVTHAKERPRRLVRALTDGDDVLRVDAARLVVIREEPGRVEDAVTEHPELLESFAELWGVERFVEQQRERPGQRLLDRAARLGDLREQRDHV